MLLYSSWCTPSGSTDYILTHWGRVTHICIGKLTIIGSDNGLSPGRRQAIIWTNAGVLLIGPLGRKFSEILIGIQTSSLKKMHLKMSSAKWPPFYLGLNVLTLMLRSEHSRSIRSVPWFHICSWTKWLPFCRRHFHMHFLEWKCLNLDSKSTEICS